MSESTAIGTVNRPGAVKIGTVGPPAPNVELKLAADGEVLLRGDFLMAGYRNAPEKTAEAFDPDGWLRTGDIGTIDDEGYLKIVDRKKEIMINAAGKNMSPDEHRGGAQVGQPAHRPGLQHRRPAPLRHGADRARRRLRAAVGRPAGPGGTDARGARERGRGDRRRAGRGRRCQRELARVEQVKRFTIIPGDWGGDELTPTMKLKRKPIEAKYAAQIDAMYG